MPREKILGEQPLTMGELKKHLESIQKRDGELNYRATRTLEYLNHLPLAKETEKILAKIVELNIPRLKELHVAKIVDLMPTTVDEVKMALSGYIVTVNQDNLKKILTVLDEFRK